MPLFMRKMKFPVIRPSPILSAVPFDASGNRSIRQVKAIYAKTHPTRINNPRVVAISPAALCLIGLEDDSVEKPAEYLEYVSLYLSGTAIPEGSLPAAHCYAGYQFGAFAGQLGDGAALLLGSSGEYEVGLKGSGLTPFSRLGDGRKVLRSSIREFLGAEFMAGMGIPTVRCGSVVVSAGILSQEDDLDDQSMSEPTRVIRDVNYNGNPKWEKCAVVSRISRSFLRFGSFEIARPIDLTSGREGPCAANPEIVKSLLDWTRDALYQGVDISMFLQEIALRTGRLVALWQAQGFTHGVLNTDNLSVLGETIDFGPFGWMEYTDFDYVPNTSDRAGRYAFSRQKDVCRWNLSKLVEAVFLLDDVLDRQHAHEVLAKVVQTYDASFDETFQSLMRQKLGIGPSSRISHDQVSMVTSKLFALMEECMLDYTNTFRVLTDFRQQPCEEVFEKLWENRPPLTTLWKGIHLSEEKLAELEIISETAPTLLNRLGFGPETVVALRKRFDLTSRRKAIDWETRIKADWIQWLELFRSIGGGSHQDIMRRVNPKFILRNSIIQESITKAENEDFELVQELLKYCHNPFDANIPDEFCKPSTKEQTCTLSCSS